MGKKILIIDDDRLNTTIVKFRLSEQNYDVDIAINGFDGLEKIKQSRPDLIVLDIRMPRMNGYEFMQELITNQAEDRIPVIMLTADETMQDIFQAEGVIGYYVKPVDMESFLSQIKDYLKPEEDGDA
ncbi:MAG: response regulator [Candidatus Omnitrophica bacterium]|nr:response regulator [Candidatus Omnitrophota bacterium]